LAPQCDDKSLVDQGPIGQAQIEQDFRPREGPLGRQSPITAIELSIGMSSVCRPPREERAGEGWGAGKSNKNATPLPGPRLLLRRKRGRRARSIPLIPCQWSAQLRIQSRMRKGFCRTGTAASCRGRIGIARSSEIVKASLLRLLRGGMPPRTQKAQRIRAWSAGRREGYFITCYGRGSYQISHSEKFDKYLHQRQLSKHTVRMREFWLQAVEREALQREGGRRNVECRMRSLTTDHAD